VTFTSTVQMEGSLDYLWRFGDGGTSTAADPTHTYQTNGLFTVSLWVTDDVTTEVVTRTGYVAVGDGRVIEYVYDDLYPAPLRCAGGQLLER
jgi:PKD repeat protein